jgi:hypothetical protein
MLALTPQPEMTVPAAESPYKQTVINFVIGGLDAAVAAAAGKAPR